MKTKNILTHFSALILAAMFVYSGCADVNYNNPADPKSGAYRPTNIELTVNDEPFENGETYQFSAVSLNDSTEETTFIITNTGFDDLIIKNIYFEGEEADQFILDELYAIGDSPLAGGSDTFFKIKFRPVEYGAKTATVKIESSDPDAGTFSFTITGTALKPRIAVYRGDELIPVQNGDVIYLGDGPEYIANPNMEFVFYVENRGDDDLTIYDLPEFVNISEFGTPRFGVAKSPRFIVEPGKTSTFIISLENAFNTDFHYADVVIKSNDSDIENYTFYLKMKSHEKLKASDGAADDCFCQSVSRSGGYAVVGAYGDDSETGSAYIFKFDGTSWVQQAKLTASDGLADDRFGYSVSISGDYAVVGAYGDDSEKGSAYIFKRNGTDWGTWNGGTSTYNETAKITASDGVDDDRFGFSVSISGDYAVIGAIFGQVASTWKGSAYIFMRDGASWTQQAKLTASDGATSDWFGISVSISGDYAVIGASGDDTWKGSAYIFKRNGTDWGLWNGATSSYNEIAKITEPDRANNDGFGWSVSINDDYALIGAGSDHNGSGDPVGSAYIFEKPVTGWATTSTYAAKLTASDGAASDAFGQSVSISGDYAVVGAPSDDDGGLASGSAYIFMRDGTSWTEQKKITASDAAENDYFGCSVFIYGGYAMVGAYGDDSKKGSVYAYLMPSPPDQVKLTASDGAADDWFGQSVSISGDYAVIGAYGDDDNGNFSGSAYVYSRNGRSWSRQAKLTASDGAGIDCFGSSVSISGDYAVIGATNGDGNVVDSGSAYIFKRDGTSWPQQAKLFASDGSLSEYFGCSVSINGDYALIGANCDDAGGYVRGSAYIFKRDGTSWTEQDKLTPSDPIDENFFGQSVSISGDYALIGATGDDGMDTQHGAAYIFKRDGTSWAQEAKLTASDGAGGDCFGWSVSISGDYALVGASVDDSNKGSAYIFKRDGTSWPQQAKLTASDGDADNWFGSSVSISGDDAVIGAYNNYAYGLYSGSAFMFKRAGTLWTQQMKFTAIDAASNDQFGYSVSISGDYAVIGAFYDDDKGNDSGSAYIYTAH